jgi:hypothetical protein
MSLFLFCVRPPFFFLLVVVVVVFLITSQWISLELRVLLRYAVDG